MKRRAWWAALLAAVTLALAGSCDSVPVFLIRASDTPVRTAPQTLGHFRLDGNLENAEGTLEVTASSPDLEYRTLDSGAQVATVGYPTQIVDASDRNEDGGVRPVLEIELPGERIPGTVSFRAHRLPLSSGISMEDDGRVTAIVTVSTESNSMEGQVERWSAPPERQLSAIVEFPKNTTEWMQSAVRADARGHALRGGQIPSGQAANPTYHVALTIDAGGAARLFVDGEESDRLLSYNYGPVPDTLYLLVAVDTHEREDSQIDPDTGLETATSELLSLAGVDNLRLYRHALTHEEVRRIYETERQDSPP